MIESGLVECGCLLVVCANAGVEQQTFVARDRLYGQSPTFMTGNCVAGGKFDARQRR